MLIARLYLSTLLLAASTLAAVACDCGYRQFVPAKDLLERDPVWVDTQVISATKSKPDKNGFPSARITARVTSAIKGIRPGKVITFLAGVDTSCDPDMPKPGDTFPLSGRLVSGRYETSGHCSPWPDDQKAFEAIVKARRADFSRLEAAVAGDPGTTALDRLSSYLVEKHDWGAAIDSIREAIQRDPSGDRTYELALAVAGSGDKPNAVSMLKRAAGKDARARVLLAGLTAPYPAFGDQAKECPAVRTTLDLAASPLPGRNLTQLTLEGLDVSGLDARGADLTSSSLRCTKLSGGHLEGADLRNADLRGADLSDAKLAGADLSGAATDCTTRLPADRQRDVKCEAPSR